MVFILINFITDKMEEEKNDNDVKIISEIEGEFKGKS